MKKFLKNNILFIIIAILVLTYALGGCFGAINNQRESQNRIDNMVEKCQNTANMSDKMYEQCQTILQDKDIKMDSYTLLSDIILYRINYLNPLAFSIVVIPTLYGLCKILKNKYIINSNTRESYSQFLKKFFKQAYKYCWFIPLIALIILVACFTSFTNNPEFSILNMSSIWNSKIINNSFLFCLLYELNIFLYSCIFINIALIMARKYHKFIVAVILSILTYIGIQLFLEVVINILICQMIFHSDIGYLFNIMNLFTFSDTYGIFNLMLFTFTIFIISIIGVYLCYRNKEKLIMDCEKNN